ncbi:MAG: sigma-70 family RNA polymerase sigma factor [Clostridia bacterium]|nr:sigma-70 family RNA polymerase sigma factor [Clostridia bacterium]
MSEDFINDRMESLLSQTKAGNNDAFDKIAEQYRPLIDGCICYFYGVIDTDELEQEALIALYRAACSYDPEVSCISFGLYAKICINNSLISLVRTYKRQEFNAAEPMEFEDSAGGELDPSVDYINRESFMLLDRFVRKHLSAYEYSVFRLYIEGYKIKEIARQLSKTEKSVEGAIMRMRIKLRRILTHKDL